MVQKRRDFFDEEHRDTLLFKKPMNPLGIYFCGKLCLKL